MFLIKRVIDNNASAKVASKNKVEQINGASGWTSQGTFTQPPDATKSAPASVGAQMPPSYRGAPVGAAPVTSNSGPDLPASQKSAPGGSSPSRGPRQAAQAADKNSAKNSQPDVGPRRKSYEAEDLPTDNQRKPTSFGKKPNLKKGFSFTEDSAEGGGWIRKMDEASGRPYWYHYKTLETRWDKPTKTGGTASTPPTKKPRKGADAQTPGQDKPGPSAQSTAGTENPAAAGLDTSGLESAEEVARVKADVNEQLEKTRKEDLPSRKKTFKFLCLRWHPDKNADDPELATQIFQYIQQQRDWYLKE